MDADSLELSRAALQATQATQATQTLPTYDPYRDLTRFMFPDKSLVESEAIAQTLRVLYPEIRHQSYHDSRASESKK